jgi:hypothetical protein
MCQMCEEYEAELRRLGIAMDEITVTFEPDELDELHHLAKAHGHSVPDEVQAIVRQRIARKPAADIDFVAWAKRIRAMTPAGTPQTDSLTLLREDRDR